jgi:mannose-6-phosphate isomerase-like protein (cupin superfamily)
MEANQLRDAGHFPAKRLLSRGYRFVRLRPIEMEKDSLPATSDYQSEPVRYRALERLDIIAEATTIEQCYRNIVLNQVNNHCLRLAVIQGEYPWHYHPHSDELFLIVQGCLFIDLVGGREIRLEPWQSITIPANTVHRTRAVGRTVNLCFEQLAAETVFLEVSPQ